jgi:hypothetical protein
VDLESLECGGKASILLWVNLNLVIMDLAPDGRKMKKKQRENLSKKKTTRSSGGSVVFGTGLKGKSSRLETQDHEAMSS